MFKFEPVSKPMHREESEQQLIHRLEAFSDIVIGFSLTELTLRPTATCLIRRLRGRKRISSPSV